MFLDGINLSVILNIGKMYGEKHFIVNSLYNLVNNKKKMLIIKKKTMLNKIKKMIKKTIKNKIKNKIKNNKMNKMSHN